MAKTPMNECQELWWQQVKSDHSLLLLLRREGANPCHQLHYLQMVTEKLGKAYFWRSNNPPSTRSHSVFGKFLRALSGANPSERQRITSAFKSRDFRSFQFNINKVKNLAYELERLAPALAEDGPSPEYPWPQKDPRHTPASYDFDLWKQLQYSANGRMLLKVIDAAVESFQAYC